MNIVICDMCWLSFSKTMYLLIFPIIFMGKDYLFNNVNLRNLWKHTLHSERLEVFWPCPFYYFYVLRTTSEVLILLGKLAFSKRSFYLWSSLEAQLLFHCHKPFSAYDFDYTILKTNWMVFTTSFLLEGCKLNLFAEDCWVVIVSQVYYLVYSPSQF